MPESQRIREFLPAFSATRNTTWNRVVRGILRDLWGVEITDERSVREADQRIKASSTGPGWASRACGKMAIREVIGHAILAGLQRHSFHVQLFLGIRHGPATVHPLNNVLRITDMHPVLAAYRGCTFEILNGAELSNLDVVQATGLLGNVYAGALWWFNFRPSSCLLRAARSLPRMPGASSGAMVKSPC